MIIAKKCSTSESKEDIRLWGKWMKWWAIWWIHLTVHCWVWSIVMKGRGVNLKEIRVWVWDIYLNRNRSGIVTICGYELYQGHWQLVSPGWSTHLPPLTQTRYVPGRSSCTSSNLKFILIEIALSAPALCWASLTKQNSLYHPVFKTLTNCPLGLSDNL